MILANRTLGTGGTVVLLHGLFGSARNLGGVARALASRHRVVSLDLRNHGDSGHDASMDYAAMAADVLETLDSVGALPAAVLGHSMGGKVAMRLALTTPAAVSRLVVADIAPVSYPSHFGGFGRAMLALPPHLSRTEADAALECDIPEAAVRSFLLHNFRPGEGWRIGLAEIVANLPYIEAWDDVATSYGGPTLFVSGARSDYILPEHRPVIQALFPAARLVTIKDAGHWLHSEQPKAFAATASAFLASG